MLGVQTCWENKNVGKSKLLGDQNSFKYTESVSRLRSVHSILFSILDSLPGFLWMSLLASGLNVQITSRFW